MRGWRRRGGRKGGRKEGWKKYIGGIVGKRTSGKVSSEARAKRFILIVSGRRGSSCWMRKEGLRDRQDRKRDAEGIGRGREGGEGEITRVREIPRAAALQPPLFVRPTPPLDATPLLMRGLDAGASSPPLLPLTRGDGVFRPREGEEVDVVDGSVTAPPLPPPLTLS